MIKKIAVGAFLFLMFTLFIGMPVMGYLMYIEAPPASYARRAVLTKSVPPGGILKIAISADLTKRCDAVVYRTIIDSNGVLFELLPENRRQETDYIVDLFVPLGAAEGPAYYSARIVWKCNIVQQFFPVEVLQRNLPFNIAPSEGQFPNPAQQGIYSPPVKKSELAKGEIH